LKALLGRKCLLNVTHTEKGSKVYANIANATPIPKGMQSDYPQANASLYFDLNDADQAAFEQLPKWLKEKIEGRIQEKLKTLAQQQDERNPPPAEFNDDIPW
jgi:hypothetical protein